MKMVTKTGWIMTVLLYSVTLPVWATNTSPWQVIFDEYAAQGTLVILDERHEKSQFLVFNEPRSQQR